MKRRIFRRNGSWLSIFLLFFVLSFYSCKKIDTPPAKQAYAEKFFEKPSASSAELQALIDRLKKENERTGFINTLPGNAGLPVWDKLVKEKPVSKPGVAARGVITGEDGNLLIPLSGDGKTLSALLFVIKQDDQYEFYYYDNEYAYRICHNKYYTVQQREKVAGAFMFMSNYVFGINKFKDIPRALFETVKGTDDVNDTKRMVLKPIKEEVTPGIENLFSGPKELCFLVATPEDCTCGTRPICQDWEDGCEACSDYICLTLWETEPPPINPNGGNGTTPANPGSTTGGNSGGTGTSPLPTEDHAQTSPNLPCYNCAWYAEAPEYEFDLPVTYSETVLKLRFILDLNPAQSDWLKQNSIIAEEIYHGLQESLADENPENNLAYQYIYPQDAIAASKMTIDAAMNNLIAGPYDDNHFAIIDPYLIQSSSAPDPMFWFKYSLSCALLKFEHPEYSNIKVYWEVGKEMVHGTLDLVGLVPGYGEIADLTNGIIYTLEGEGIDAALSFAAAIPIIGWYPAGIKFCKWTITALDGSKRTLHLVVDAAGKINFGERALLRKVLGLAKGDARVAHHLIPWEHCADDLVQKAAQGNNAFHMNDILNGIPLTAVQHTGSHQVYNSRVKDYLTQIKDRLIQDGTFTPAGAKAAIESLINDVIKPAILNNPNVPINQIVF